MKKDDVLILRGVKNDGEPQAVYSGLTPNHRNCKGNELEVTLKQ